MNKEMNKEMSANDALKLLIENIYKNTGLQVHTVHVGWLDETSINHKNKTIFEINLTTSQEY